IDFRRCVDIRAWANAFKWNVCRYKLCKHSFISRHILLGPPDVHPISRWSDTKYRHSRSEQHRIRLAFDRDWAPDWSRFYNLRFEDIYPGIDKVMLARRWPRITRDLLLLFLRRLTPCAYAPLVIRI